MAQKLLGSMSRVNIACSFLVRLPSFYTIEKPINYFSNVTSESNIAQSKKYKSKVDQSQG